MSAFRPTGAGEVSQGFVSAATARYAYLSSGFVNRRHTITREGQTRSPRARTGLEAARLKDPPDITSKQQVRCDR
eukprot:2808630-Pleurochrysis_carterae.AAC.1